MIPHWFKFQRNLLTTAQAMSAGTDAVLVFLDACGLCFDAESLDGEIPASRVPAIGRTLLAHDGWSRERLQAAVAAATLHGLLSPGEQIGSLLVRDWAEFIRPPIDGQTRTANWRARARDDSPVTGVTDEHVTQKRKRREDHRTPPPQCEPQGGGGGGGEEQPSALTPEQQDMADTLGRCGIFLMSKSKRYELACILVTRGRNPHDIEDLASHAKTKEGLKDPGAWMAQVLQDPAAMVGALNDAARAMRGSASIYGEDAPALIGPGDPSRVPDPTKFGMKWCDACKGQAVGEHWKHHGPVGWRPGDPIPHEQPPEAPRENPMGDPADWMKSLAKKTDGAKGAKSEAEMEAEHAKKLLKFKKWVAKNEEASA